MDTPEVPDELLRPALEVAFVVAVVGARQRPPIAAPPLVAAVPETAEVARPGPRARAQGSRK